MIPRQPFPTDAVLAERLEMTAGRAVTDVHRTPLAYSTSFPIDHARVTFEGGSTADVAVKDLRWQSLIGDAPATKPPDLHSPPRCIGVHRHVLDPAGLGPRLWAAGSGDPPDGEWLAVELVAGAPLWEIGDVSLWEAVARWLGEFHTRMRPTVAGARAAVPELIDFSPAWMGTWLDRASTALASGSDPRRHEALDVIDKQRAEPPPPGQPTVVHGEFYASNVMVASDGRICPIDWELAGAGEPMLDLAALVTGWEDDVKGRLVAAYVGAIGRSHDELQLARSLSHARVLNAARWIGWSPGWEPPAAHAHDWVAEILDAGRLGG